MYNIKLNYRQVQDNCLVYRDGTVLIVKVILMFKTKILV
jgi:hypothetical protein